MNFEEPISHITPVFLTHLKIDSFGAFSNKVVGPFDPYLNVVFGNNEAGKTTMNAFFSGVLFGWEEARGNRNTYKPHNAERSGTLFFHDLSSGESFELSRSKNADGLQGPVSYVDDIDKETHSTMFALTSDELRSLKNTTDVTAKLLTAGSGTGASPAHALNEIQSRVAEYGSRASGIEHSLVQLKQQQDELRASINEAASEAERYKKQDREFHELAPQRDELLQRIDALNKEIEDLTVHRSTLEKLETQMEKTLDQRADLLEQEHRLVMQHQEHDQDRHNGLIYLDSSEEFALRERLDRLTEEQTKLDHRISSAKENWMESKARYEALIEADGMDQSESGARIQKRTQVILSVLLPVVFVAAGVPVFLHGREITSLSFTALGICLVVFAVVLASAALVMLFRPNKAEEAAAQRKKDAHWVMLQDKKKLEASEEELREHEIQVMQTLEGIGLSDAKGSLRRARSLLDEAKDERAQANLFLQKQQALVSQLTTVEDTLADIQSQKERIASQVGPKHANAGQSITLEAIDEMLALKVQQRSALNEASGTINRRFGELKQELSQAQHMTRFDELKMEYQQVCTRIDENAKDFTRLLLAKRMLESAISAWESKSQPEVYRQASRLFELMTDGSWTQVRMSPEGRLQVLDAVKTVREPLRLSLGTCQQLYLSLRIALLMSADNVGRIIPIMADDILVNFDSHRREGAIRALLDLARRRQVILFTCHEEIVRLMQTTDSQVNVLEL